MADTVTRVQYFDHQFLQVEDFSDEQKYHRELLQLHNASLHTPGIAQGLEVSFATGATKVSVAPGVAIDGDGMQIVLATERDVELASFAPGATVYLVISYAEQQAAPATDGSGNDTRTTEIPDIEGQTSAPQDGQHLLLAAIARSGTAVTGVDESGRLIAGSSGGDEAVNSLAIRVANAVPANWPTLRAPGASQAELSSSLTIDGALIAGGPNSSGATINGPLTVNGAATVTTSLTWGTNSSLLRGDAAAQGGSLELGGNDNVPGVGTPYIDFHFQGKQQDYNTRIINDADGRLSIYAATTRFTGSVAGPLVVTGGPITPAVGNSASAGIEFPNNPGGGAGDEAFIRYYVDTGAPAAGPETTRLVIGIANDPDDRLGLIQYGAERLTISGGNVGINETNPQHTFQVTSGNEVHSGGTGAGFSFANRSFNGGALQDSPSPGNIGSRWVWYAAQGPTWPGGPANPGQAWLWSGGNLVSVATNGNIGVKGYDPNSGIPSGWGGGIHTWDLYAEGTVGAGQSGALKAYINSSGVVVGSSKNFVIDHPLDSDRELVHSAIEGPEHSVFYRGEARLQQGRASITLPQYFEALCRADGRTVQVTPKVDAAGGEPGVLGVTAVGDGSFTVVAGAGAAEDQAFYWEVKAVRSDVDPLEVEPLRGAGPLTAIGPATHNMTGGND